MELDESNNDFKFLKERILWKINEKTSLAIMVYSMFEGEITKKDFVNMTVEADDNEKKDIEYECLKLSIQNFEITFGKTPELNKDTKWVVVRFFEYDKVNNKVFPIKDFIPEQKDKIKIWLTKLDKKLPDSEKDKIYNISDLKYQN